MDLLLSWVAFPLVLSLLCLGCGLAFEAIAGLRVPRALIPACGLALIVVLGQFLALAGETASLIVPAVVMVAGAGAILAIAERRAMRPPPILVLALAGVFAVYAAPIALSGEATLAGFIKLDDTATWLAFTDHVMSDGRELEGLAPSTFEATLAVNIGEGYPVGAFVPLGVGARLVGADPAWLIQPYMAFVAVLLALGLWSLTARIVDSRRARAAIAFLAAQPALLFGYYLWGGVKELLAAALIASFAALAANAVAHPADRSLMLAPALTGAALIGVLSGGGALWLLPALAVALVVLARALPLAELCVRAAEFAVALGILILPVIAAGGLLPPTSSPLDSGAAKGNLIEPLDPLQVAGIWPVRDFRLEAEAAGLTYPLVALVLALAVVGLMWAWRRRGLGALLGLAAALGGAAALGAAGSPWVDGKALATASPLVLLAALAGAFALASSIRTWLGVAAGIAIAVGVLWSNALAYQGVNLAPRAQLAELEEVGELIAGEGPTLMTEYSPYGARHFLRDAAPEAVSELRRRTIPLLNGETVRNGFSADTDQLDPEALVVYRTLVLRRSPTRSRPPAAYELVRAGQFYEVWQRRPARASLPPRLPLGSFLDPASEPRCADVLALARGGRSLVAARATDPVIVPLSAAEYPAAWARAGFADAPVPEGTGSIAARVRIDRAGDYEVWLGESVRPSVELAVDGEVAGRVRHELNNHGQFVSFGPVTLEAGGHTVELRFGGADLHPGSGGIASPVGPLALSRSSTASRPLVRVAAPAARQLCGREWDWIEVAR